MADDPFGDLKTGTRGALWRNGIRTVEEVQFLSDAELLALQGFGSAALADARRAFPRSLANWVGEGVPDA